MGRIYSVARVICLVGVCLPGLARAANVWQASSPYPGNPLKVATLVGVGHVGAKSFPITLELSCHPEAAVPRAVLRVPLTAGGWNFNDYLGPVGGAGQRRRSLQVLGRGARALDQPRFSGIDGDHVNFMFSWQPNDAFLGYLGKNRDWVSIHLDAVRRSQGALDARFDLPPDSATLLSVVGPCYHPLVKGGASQ